MPPTTTPMSRRKVAAHGTRSGYHRHLRNNEKPCEACNDANNSRPQAWGDANRAYARAYQRALRRLRDLHPDLFDALLVAERQREASGGAR